MTGGYYKMYRGWMDSSDFKRVSEKAPLCERAAWIWLIERAAWKPRKCQVGGTEIQLQRSQLIASFRYLARAWGWDKERVRRFLKVRRERDDIRRENTTPGETGGSLITICNYEKYQSDPDLGETADETETRQLEPRTRDKEEEERTKKVRKKDSDYAFSGAIVRLTWRDFANWQGAYKAVPDLRAALQKRDDWLATLPASDRRRKDWFLPTSNWLAKENKQHLAEQAQGSDAYDPDVIH